MALYFSVNPLLKHRLDQNHKPRTPEVKINAAAGSTAILCTTQNEKKKIHKKQDKTCRQDKEVQTFNWSWSPTMVVELQFATTTVETQESGVCSVCKLWKTGDCNDTQLNRKLTTLG